MKNESLFTTIMNGRAVQLSTIPVVDIGPLSQYVISEINSGKRIAAFFGAPTAKAGITDLYIVLADDEANCLYASKTCIEGEGYPSLTPSCPQAHLFEREIAEQFGLKPKGHPWLKPVRYHRSWTSRDSWDRNPTDRILPAVGDFYRVEGDQVHEVAVGPVHAGVIEPGHFRFQCHGEEIFHLEIALGYQHRGIERALIGGPTPRSLHYAETLAGDTTVGHAISYCQVLEAMVKSQKSARAQVLRGIALELERLANHVGDLGALANDVGYLPTASFCGRLRGDYLNLTARLCGSRFGRGMIQPGGVGFDVDEAMVDDMLKKLITIEKDTADAVNLLWETQSVLSRFEDTGKLSRQTAVDLGLVGPAARACGLVRDVRYNLPSGIYRFAQIPVATYESGDVFARAYIRWLEIQKSIPFIKTQLEYMPGRTDDEAPDRLEPNSMAVALNEGWRGEICHVAITDRNGKFSRYKVVDPSFHNWTGLAMTLRNQAISDFPLCNKSFNLSYCGHDL